MSAHHRGEIWLGELIAAVGDLAPDAAALAEAARMLGLGAAAGPAHLEAPLKERFEREQPHEPGPDARAEAAAREAAATQAAGAAGSSHRLPLVATPAFTASPADAIGPKWLESQAALPAVDRFDPPRPAPPLLPARTRRAVLTRLLATTAFDGAPDVARIVAQVGRGRPLTQLPRKARQTLRHGAELRCDFAPWLEPFAPDQEDLLHALDRLLPAGRLRALAISGAPEPADDDPDAVLLRAGSPSPGAPLLLASDLGRAWRSLGERGATPAQWRRFIDVQRKAGRRVAVLAPAARAHARRMRGVALLPWAERSGLGDVRRALAGQGRWPRPATSNAVPALAQQVSVAQQVSPCHLRMARRALGQSPAAECELWFSDLVQSRGIEGLVIVPQAAALLRAALQGERLQQALALRDAAHDGRHVDDGQGLEEALHDLELRHELDAGSAEHVLRPALKSIADGDRDVALWAAHAWDRLSPAVREQPAVRQLAFAASSLLSTGAWLVDARGRRPTLPGDSAWLLHELPAERDRIGVELRDYADGSRNLVFGPADAAPTNAFVVIDLPRTRPLWLRVSGGTEGPDWVQTVSLEPGATQQVDVPAGPQVGTVRVEAMDGSAWLLESISNLEAAVDASLLVVRVGRVQPPVGVALTDSLLVVPFGLGGTAVDHLRPGDPVDIHRPNAQGATSNALVVGTLRVGTVNILVLRRDLQAPPWTPLDPQLRAAQRADPRVPHATARFIRLTERGAAPGAAIVGKTWAIYAQPEEGDFAPALGSLIAPSGEGEWHLAWGVEPDLTVEKRHPNDADVSSVAWPELLTQVEAFAARSRRWRWLLIGSPDVERVTYRLWDEFQRPGADVEVDYDHDGRTFGALRPAVPTPQAPSPIAGYDALLVVCGSEPPRELPDLVRRAILSEMPRVWLPLAGGPQESLRGWPQDLSWALMQWQASKVDGRALQAGDQGAFDSVVKEVLTLPSHRRGAPQADGVAEGRDEAPRVASATPASAPSLRARLLNALDKRSDAEIGLFKVEFGEASGCTLKPASWPRSSAPSLLLIHGEAGDAEPSFDKLLNQRDGHWQRLRDTYAGRVLAWRWRGIALSPVRNALALARTLGGGAPAHVLSHGAGGLLPELMALAAAVGPSPDAMALDALARWRSAPTTRPADITAWNELVAALGRTPVDLRRFVRVACPVEGTDLFEQGVRMGTSLWSMALPIVGSALVKLAGIDKLLSDPDLSPGLVALKPGEGLQPLLTPRLRTSMPLTVVAGSIRGASTVSWLKASLASWALGGREGDLVVSLPSAFGGLERERGVDWLVDIGSQVTHFNYFANEHTRSAIVEALCAPDGQLPAGLRHADSLAEVQRRLGSRGVLEAAGSAAA